MNSVQLLASTVAGFCCSLIGTFAFADSCWMHNGSVMRLSANGQNRTISYEVPRRGLSQIGVYPGRVLFEGQRFGQSMSGNARLFSTQCLGNETVYAVQGSIAPNSTRITLVGSRPIYNNCVPTGRFARDTLVFTFVNQCQ